MNIRLVFDIRGCFFLFLRSLFLIILGIKEQSRSLCLGPRLIQGDLTLFGMGSLLLGHRRQLKQRNLTSRWPRDSVSGIRFLLHTIFNSIKEIV